MRNETVLSVDAIELDGDVGLSKTHGGALLLTHAAAGVIYRLLPQTIFFLRWAWLLNNWQCTRSLMYTSKLNT